MDHNTHAVGGGMSGNFLEEEEKGLKGLSVLFGQKNDRVAEGRLSARGQGDFWDKTA